MVWRSFPLFSIWTPTAPWGMRRSPMSTGIRLFPHFLCLAQGSARNSCAVEQPSWISLWTRGDRRGCSGGMEPSTSVTSPRTRRLWSPALPRYYWTYRTVRLKDRSMSRLSLGGDRRGGPVKCNFLNSYLNRTSEIWSRQRRQAWKYYVFSSAQVNRSRSLFRDLLDGVHSVIKRSNVRERPEYFSQTFNNFVTSYRSNSMTLTKRVIGQIYFPFVALQNLLLKL